MAFLLIGLCLFAAAPATARSFCVLVPHFKDEYWLSVGYGLEQEARAHDIGLVLREAGGYRARDEQIAQIDACVARKADAILIGAVTSDHPDLIAAVARAAETVPVFALVNALDSPALSGAVGVDWRDMGAAVGAYLAQRYPANGERHQAVFITGPPESGWTAPLEQGLRSKLAASGVEIAATYWADTGLAEQLDLVETALQDFPQAEIVIGSAPAIEGAMGHLRAHQTMRRQPVLISTYVTHTVKRGLMSGQIAFAPFDDPMQQGRMAIAQAISHLAGKGRQGLTGPAILGLQANAPGVAAIDLSPAEYFPRIE